MIRETRHNTVSVSSRSTTDAHEEGGNETRYYTRGSDVLIVHRAIRSHAKRLMENDRCVRNAQATVRVADDRKRDRRRVERGTVANISKSNNESGRLDDTITPSMCGNAARIRATLVECLLSGIDRYGNRFSFET